MTEVIAEFQESFDDVFEELCYVLYQEGLTVKDPDDTTTTHKLGDDLGVKDYELIELQTLVKEHFGVDIEAVNIGTEDTIGDLAEAVFYKRRDYAT